MEQEEMAYPEFEEYINNQPHLKPLSVRTYKNQYITLRKYLDEFRSLEEKFLVSFILDLEKNGDPIDNVLLSTNTLINYITIIVQVRHYHSPDVNNNEELIKLRDKYKALKLRQKNIKNQTKLKGLPSKEQLIHHMNMAFQNGNWRDYIILYLIIYYHTRNQDLDVALVSSIKQARNENYNYLVIKPSHVNFIRFKYKTRDRYGRKTFSIKAQKFREAINNFLEEMGGFQKDTEMLWLISVGSNKRLSPDSVAKWIRARTLDNISTNDYNKIIMSDAIDRNDAKLIEEISERRGTSIQTLITEYDLKI